MLFRIFFASLFLFHCGAFAATASLGQETGQFGLAALQDGQNVDPEQGSSPGKKSAVTSAQLINTYTAQAATRTHYCNTAVATARFSSLQPRAPPYIVC